MATEYFTDTILDRFVIPQIVFPQDTNQQKAALAWHILSLKDAELLLCGALAFSYSGIIAGISQNAIEYIAKNAPRRYRVELLESLKKNYVQKEVFEIAKSMDEDLGKNTTQNQDRIKNLIQYIKDNRGAFEF
jgi:hypothetical protein